MAQPGERLSAVQPEERIREIDVLRGFALFGVLIVNVQLFNDTLLSYSFFHENPFQYADPSDRGVAVLIQTLVIGKFYTLFSLLFGLGFYMFMDRLSTKGIEAGPIYRRRMATLLVFGLLNIGLFWYGDILTVYAVTGSLLYLFRNKSMEQLKKWAIGLLGLSILVISGLTALQTLAMEMMSPEEMEAYRRMVEQSLTQYQSDDYAGTVLYRLQHEMPMVLASYLFWIPKVLGLFLVGLMIGKSGFFRQLQDHWERIRQMVVRAALVGWPLTAGYLILDAGWLGSGASIAFVSQLAQEVSALALSIFYAGGLLLIWRNPHWREKLEGIELVGRGTLTHYIAHSVFLSLFFYGHGLGRMHQMPLWQLMILALFFYIMQTLVSRAYLSRHSHGPFEQIWRDITYKGLKATIRS